MAFNNKHFVVKYLECMRNYAAKSNGHIVDGCGEFCPTGAPGTLESFICAACHCHRNFHRKIEVEVEVEGEDDMELPIHSTDYPNHDTPLDIVDNPPPQPRAQLGETLEKNNIDMETETETDIEGGEIEMDELKRKYSSGSSSSSMRMRLDPYQRERIWAFARDIMGWRWTKNHEQIIPFCEEIGITPEFLKNWINNTRRRIEPLGKLDT